MEDGGYRTHQRVECFVKRHLGQDVCNSLRISEPCIVVGGSYSHAFKFIVLTDDTLYIFANPPQAENDIEMRIELQQISEVKYVHDIPEFLSGDLQKNAQHFRMTYRKSDLSPQANLKPEQKNNGKRNASSYLKTFQENPVGSKTAVGAENQPAAGRNSNSSVIDELMREDGRSSTIRFKFDDHDDDCQIGRDRSYSDPLRITELPAEAKAAIAVPLKLNASQNVRRKGAKEPNGSEKTISNRTSRPLPPPAPGTEMTNAMIIKGSPNLRVSGRRRRMGDRKPDDSKSKDGAVQTISDPCLRGAHPSESSAIRHKSFPLDRYSHVEMPDLASRSTSFLTTEKNGSSKHLNQSLSARIGSFFGKTDEKASLKSGISKTKTPATQDDNFYEEDVFPTDSNVATVDVYLLNGESQMVPLLKSTRINSIMSKTLRMGRVRERSSSVDRSKMLEEFNLLKEDILNCTEIERAFILTKELLSGATKRPLIKTLFWKTQELINYYHTILDSYLINHAKIVFHGDEADELDYMLIIADLIVCMIFNTEILQSRNKILFGHRGSIVYKMMKTSMWKPDLLKKQESQVLSNAAALLLAGVDHQRQQSDKEIELDNLLGEWTDACSSLVYELLNATEQCSWTYRETKEISLHNLITNMESHSQVESFLQDLIGRILMRLLKGHSFLKHSEVVLLYKQFTVLSYVIEYSPALSKFLSDHYYEEFRYYIGSPKHLSRIPECPVAPMLRAVIAEVIDLMIKQ
ncbi:uncharacterized protein C12orf56-like [Rhopilema esculentum]|uniref:uncharacterized protein C12orf56-like n=1 Tax=Rhopilema esculentum TaxID=499914 RepID=UPI0031E2F831|eukprot:gene1960-17500_t